MSFTKELYKKVILHDNVYPKALAHFLFREIIEDAHSKYNIPNDEIKKMCKEAVNRAALFLEIQKDPELYKGFAIEAFDSAKWDEPVMTDDLKERLEFYRELSKELDL